jgi:quercetin dioxygenase-like cupin family protein
LAVPLTHVKSTGPPHRYLEGMNERPLIDAEREKILSLSAEAQYAPNGIVSRTLLRTANSRVVLFGFAEGQELTEHTSTQHAVIQILSGECEFYLAGQPNALKAGDLLYMPPHMAHAVKATTQFSMLLSLSRPAAVVGPASPRSIAKL